MYEKRLIYCSQRWTQNLWHIKMDFFAKIVYSLKSLTILTRSFYLKSDPESASDIFSDLHLVQTFIILPTVLKISWTWTLSCQLFMVYTRSLALDVGHVQIWQKGYHSNVCYVVLRFGLILGRSLLYLLVLLLLTLNIRCLLWMSLNAFGISLWNTK